MSYFMEQNTKAIMEKRELSQIERMSVLACLEQAEFALELTRNLKLLCAVVDMLSTSIAATEKEGLENLANNEALLEEIRNELVTRMDTKYGAQASSGASLLIVRILPILKSFRSTETLLDMYCLIIESLRHKEGHELYDEQLPLRLLTMEFAS